MEKQKKHFIGLIGPTGAGKTEISKHMRKKHGFFYIPSVTTRPPRKGNLSEYKHVNIETFEAHIKNKELLEYAVFAEHYYGKLKKDVENHLKKGHCLYTLTTDKVKKLKEKYEHIKIVCIMPEDPILKIIEKRLKKRGYDHIDMKKRLKTVEKDLLMINDLKNEKLIDHFVQTLENDYHHALKEINTIIKHYRNAGT